MNQIHKHHIVPKWRCKELGINPDFKDNLVEMTRLQHAHVHWGYYNKNLKPLFEVCKPKQYVLDMLKLGNNKDSLSAVYIAQGEIDGMDVKGKNNPTYIDGRVTGKKFENGHWNDIMKKYQKNWFQKWKKENPEKYKARLERHKLYKRERRRKLKLEKLNETI